MRRDRKIDAWLDSVAYGDIPELISLLNQQTASKLNRELKLRLFRKLAGNDPRAAADLAIQQPDGDARQAVIDAVATVWATLNVGDAIAWARDLPEDRRAGPLLKIANEALANDPHQALELAVALPSSDARNELIARAASEWAGHDPQQIASWAENISDQHLREDVISKVAVTWGESDPAKAAELAILQLSDGKPKNDAVIGIVQRWVQTKPSDAAAWVSNFPEGDLRETAAREVANLWTDRNAADAGKWVNDLPPGKSKDAAVNTYVQKIAVALPEAAAQWAATIPELDLREREMLAVAESWLAKDPQAARRWIQNSTLPNESKEKLLAPDSSK